jgi:hypothetical protein
MLWSITVEGFPSTISYMQQDEKTKIKITNALEYVGY